MSHYIAEPTSRKKIREITKLVREVFGMYDEDYFPIVGILEKGLEIIDPKFNFEIIDPLYMPNKYGVTYPEKNLIHIREDVYDNAVDGVARDRFTIAHEIGHYILHRPGRIALARNQIIEKIPAFKDPEWQANTFAAELLAPPQVIKEMTAKEITLKCGVSLEVANIQLRNL